MVEVGRVSLY